MWMKLLLLLSQSAVSLWGPRRLLFGKGPAAGTGGSFLTTAWIVLCLVMRAVIFPQAAAESAVPLLKAYPGPGCQGAAGGRRLAAEREIMQLNSIRVHQ